MAAKTKTYSFPLVIALLALFIPMFVSYLKYSRRENSEDKTYNKPNLSGIVINDNKPEFSWKNWFNGSYQLESDEYNNDHWAFKEAMVRLNNQFYYSCFNQIRVKQFVAGKDNYVISEGAIHSYYGNDYMGEEKIKDYLHKCKVIQDTLSRKGISFILAYAPGKGIGASQCIEDKYKKEIKNTNIRSFVAQSKQMGINHIDLVDYFHRVNDTTKYPLYARFAHHWTYYFECLCTQQIIKYIENLRKTDLPDLTWTEVEVSDSAQHRDKDVLESMNLYSKPKREQKLAYPKIQIENDSLKNTTRVLTVGDSYYYGIVYLNVPQYCFAGGQFWYYNNRIVPNPSASEKIEVWQLDLKEAIESNKVVMVLGSDPALPGLGWKFVQDAYEMYTSPKTYYARNETNKQIQFYAKEIRNNPTFLKKSTLKSNDLQIPLDSAIKLDAMKMAGLIK